MNKQCIICGKETKYFYTIGEGSPKVSHCKKHEIIVQTYVIELVTNDKFNAEKWLEDVRRNSQNKSAANGKRK